MRFKGWFVFLLIMAFLLTSCSGNRTPNTETTDFYTGSEGVRMQIENGAPPPRIYYYQDIGSKDYNKFDLAVDIHNVGASWTKGGIYISGYDPSLINIEGINIPKTKGGFFSYCSGGIDFNKLVSLKHLFAQISCMFPDGSGFDAGASGEGGSAGVSKLLNLLGLCHGETCPEINLNYDWTTGSFSVDLSDFSFDVLRNGRALMILLDQIKFDRFNGKQFFLAPDNYDYPGGESTVISFPGEVKSWPTGLDHTDVSFLFTTCYAYTTYATPTVCIDPDPFSQNEKACYAGQIDMKSTQGAPVAITSISQENSPKSVIFTIQVRNVGPGKVINPLHLELCSPYYPGRLGLEDLDVVFVGDIRMSGSDKRLRCSPDNNAIRLRDGRGQITCTYDLEYATAKSAYKAPLIIELWYGYSETQRRDVRIKRAS